MPKRIQRQRTKGWKMPPNAVSVTRPGKYGNPFVIGTQYKGIIPGQDLIVTRDICLPLFQVFATMLTEFHSAWLEPLRGKDLACWCKESAPCHADILLELANQ